MTATEQATSPVDRWSSPGHDRVCARAIHAQATHRLHPLDEIQVEHLLRIGYAAGSQAALDVASAALQAEPSGFITTIAPSRRRRRWWWRR